MRLTPNWFIISDTHFGHKKIVEYAQRPEDHNDLMVRNWNKVVKKDDYVLHLGDLHLTTFVEAEKYCSQLNGHKFLIIGNHDDNGDIHYGKLGFTVVEPIYKRFTNSKGIYPVIFTHEPVIDIGDWYNVHGHIHQGTHHEFGLSAHNVNMSVEVIDYTPVRLYSILAKL